MTEQVGPRELPTPYKFKNDVLLSVSHIDRGQGEIVSLPTITDLVEVMGNLRQLDRNYNFSLRAIQDIYLESGYPLWLIVRHQDNLSSYDRALYQPVLNGQTRTFYVDLMYGSEEEAAVRVLMENEMNLGANYEALDKAGLLMPRPGTQAARQWNGAYC